MQKILLVFFVSLLNIGVYAQSQIDSIINLGVQLHDQGMYEAAIEVYKQALEIDPASDLANYEIALTYMSLKNYEEAIKHSDLLLDKKSKYTDLGIVVKASCLDDLGKPEESIKLFESAIKKYGNNNMLCYNLGITYYRQGEIDKAEKTLYNGIEIDPSHPSSHMMLGLILSEKENKIPAILCLHYFLFMEPDTERSQQIMPILKELMSSGISKTSDNQITITIDSDADKKSEWYTAEISLPLLAAVQMTEENKLLSETEQFGLTNSSLFKILAESKKKKNSGLYWEFYIPFFDALARSDHFSTFNNYIHMSVDESASQWITSNPNKIEDWSIWLKEN